MWLQTTCLVFLLRLKLANMRKMYGKMNNIHTVPESERAGEHIEDVQEDHWVLIGLVLAAVVLRKLHIVVNVGLPALSCTKELTKK